MFAQSMNPSSEGLWTRLAPVAAVLSVVTAFGLSLAVLISTIQVSELLLSRAEQGQAGQLVQAPQPPPAAPCALVQGETVPPSCIGG